MNITRLFSCALWLFFACPVVGFGQAGGYDYWGVFPALNDNFGTPLLFLTSSAQSGVSITTANGTQAMTIDSGVPLRVLLASFPLADEQVERGAIHVHSGSPLSVELFYDEEYDCEATMLRESRDLGTNSLVLITPEAWYPDEFVIVAPYDSTHVAITPAVQTANGSPAGRQFTIALQSGGVYEVQNNDAALMTDLSGSIVQSDRPVAVFAANGVTNVPFTVESANPLFEELPPIQPADTVIFTLPLALRQNGDAFRLLASNDSTSVRINNGPSFMLNGAQPFDTVLAHASVIRASAPVVVAQMSHGFAWDSLANDMGDPFLFFDQSAADAVNSATFSIPDFSAIAGAPERFANNFLNVILFDPDDSSLYVDGVNVTRTLTAIPIASGVFGYQITVAAGMTHRIQSGQTFLACTYGFNPADGYGASIPGFIDSTIAIMQPFDTIAAAGMQVAIAACPGNSNDTLMAIINNGSITMHIDSITISGADAAAFAIITPLPLSIPAAPEDTAFVKLSCTALHSGQSYAVLTIWSGNAANSPYAVPVTGIKDSFGIMANDTILNFGSVQPGSRQETSVVVHNTGGEPETIQFATLPPFFANDDSIFMLPGDSAVEYIYYAPRSAGKNAGVLQLILQSPCPDTVRVHLEGDAAESSDTVHVCLALDSHIATVYEPISVVVALSPVIATIVDSIMLELHYNPRVMQMQGMSSGVCAVSTVALSDSVLRLTVRNCGTPLASALCTVTFLPLVTSTDTTFTQFTTDSILVYPPADSITASGCSEQLTVIPACGLQGVLYADSVPTISQNYPNPFAGMTTIHVTLTQNEVMGARLYVYNVLGERVADLTNQLTGNGDIAFASGELAAGVYYYVLQTAGGRWAREMFVVK